MTVSVSVDSVSDKDVKSFIRHTHTGLTGTASMSYLYNTLIAVTDTGISAMGDRGRAGLQPIWAKLSIQTGMEGFNSCCTHGFFN